jgi:hypothetical protein
MRLHWHRDPDWQLVGVWQYHHCRCGAVRIRRAYANLLGPAHWRWSRLLVDRHGQPLKDSGWRTGTGLERPDRDLPERIPPPPAGPGCLASERRRTA